MPWINREKITAVANLLKNVKARPYAFDDPDLYPESSEYDRETVARFFLVMVSMDHRLHRPGRPYVAKIDGKIYWGSDLLYKLGKLRLLEDPAFFDPRVLAHIDHKEVERWLSIENAKPPDPEVRAKLLRDLGRKLTVLYNGSALRIIELSRGRLYDYIEPGFIELLKVFRAYEDPVEKKPMLLAKMLERRGLLTILDQQNKRVPVDNHVMRIAIRLGIVKLEDNLWIKTVRGEEISKHEDVLIRMTIREAMDLLARLSSLDPFLLDDILWSAGRSICIQGKPRCRCNVEHPLCVNGSCLLSEVCPYAFKDWAPNEPQHLNTWYY